MLDLIQPLINSYWEWLKSNTRVYQINDWVEITTPYIDRHNDKIQIYAKKVNDEYILTDDGYIINDLEASGLSFDNNRRKQILDFQLQSFGIELDGKALIVKANKENFPHKKHNLVQAILSIDDLFYLSRSNVQNIFFEEVDQWFKENNIRCTPNVKFTGKSGFDHHFDFVIPRSNIRPERIVQAINNPTKQAITNFLFSWIDTNEVRKNDSLPYIMINDLEQEAKQQTINAAIKHSCKVIPWSHKTSYISELAA